MSMELGKFMWERHHAFMLPMANAMEIPGMLLEVDWKAAGFWETVFEIATLGIYPGSRPEAVRDDGTVWDLLKRPAEKDGIWRSSICDANLVRDKLKTTWTLDLGGQLPEYDLTFSVGLKGHFEATVCVTGVSGRGFDDGSAIYIAYSDLQSLEKTNQALYEFVNGDYLITECYYATKYTAFFKKRKEGSAEAAFKKAGAKFEGKTEVKWETENQLVWEGKPTVPFAVRGIEI